MDSVLSYIKSQVSKVLLEDTITDAPQTDVETLSVFKNLDQFLDDEKNQSDIAYKNAQKMATILKDAAQKSKSNIDMQVQRNKQKQLDTTKKTIDDQQKKIQDTMKLKSKQTKPIETLTKPIGQLTQGIGAPLSESEQPNSVPILKRNFARLPIGIQEQDMAPVQQQAPQTPTSAKAYVVKFDTGTQRPYEVKFTERGFAIEGTRLSFETVEHALSKNYMITLNNGQGIVLDSVKMQKILKYKGRWFPANPGSNEQSGQ